VLVALFFALGLIFGSFLTVVIGRLPRGESIVRPRSRCPACGAEIRSRDNVPVVSWVLLRGRCRACGERISAEYPLVELATAALFAAAALVVDPIYAASLAAPFLGIMLAIAVIDARHRVVPNRIVYPSLALFAVAIVVGDLAGGGVDALDAGLGLALYGVPLLLVAAAVPQGMGMGDVKLAALIGLVLGSFGLSYVGVAAGVGVIGGGIGALVALALLGAGRKDQIPFGPFLAGGAVVATLLGPRIADLYLSLLGVR
jgi:leader peptidase (prepilin peptidase) / N-methyltransferase